MRKWFECRYDHLTNSARLDIYGDIGESWWDDDAVSAKDVLEFLAALDKAAPVELHVNSGGGSVFDAFAIMTALKNHPAKVTAYVDGLAASAASYLIAAADEIVMSEVAWLMIHNASGLCLGNAADMDKTADELRRIDAAIAAIYEKRAGTGHDFAADMADETWYDAAAAVEVGLADRIEEAVGVAASATVGARLFNSAPEGAREVMSVGGVPGVACPIPEITTPVLDSSESDGEADAPRGQEPEREPQERLVEIGGTVAIIED